MAKPGKLCKTTGKRNYGSHEEAVRKAAVFFADSEVKEFRAYPCPFCKCWHLTTHAHERPIDHQMSRV